jgi:hypothetical protein
MSRSSTADLIVKNDWGAIEFIKFRELDHVVVAHSRSAVYRDEGSAGGGELAHDFVPGFAWLAGGWDVEGDGSFFYCWSHVCA